jgi:hypothetical protein
MGISFLMSPPSMVVGFEIAQSQKSGRAKRKKQSLGISAGTRCVAFQVHPHPIRLLAASARVQHTMNAGSNLAVAMLVFGADAVRCICTEHGGIYANLMSAKLASL